MKCTIRVAKTKALFSFVVTAKLICVFVFAYADCWFSHGVAHFPFPEVSLSEQNTNEPLQEKTTNIGF